MLLALRSLKADLKTFFSVIQAVCCSDETLLRNLKQENFKTSGRQPWKEHKKDTGIGQRK